MMTRKHFQAIADIINQTDRFKTPDDHWQEGHGSACWEIATALANWCATQNPNFDRSRFLQACGINAE